MTTTEDNISKITKDTIYEKPSHNPFKGEAVILTGAELKNPKQLFGVVTHRAVGWYWLGIRGPSDDKFCPCLIEEPIYHNKRAQTEMEAREFFVVDAIMTLLGRYYSDAHNLMPFENWNLTIGCANQSFLDHLDQTINDESECSTTLRAFRSVSTAKIQKALAWLACKRQPIDASVLRLLRS